MITRDNLNPDTTYTTLYAFKRLGMPETASRYLLRHGVTTDILDSATKLFNKNLAWNAVFTLLGINSFVDGNTLEMSLWNRVLLNAIGGTLILYALINAYLSYKAYSAITNLNTAYNNVNQEEVLTKPTLSTPVDINPNGETEAIASPSDAENSYHPVPVGSVGSVRL